jgi:tRNA-dihydrouridine synthase A
VPYVASHLARGGRVSNVTRHILGLYHGRPRARLFRRHLSERVTRAGAGVEVIADALAVVEQGPTTASAPVAEASA